MLSRAPDGRDSARSASANGEDLLRTHEEEAFSLMHANATRAAEIFESVLERSPDRLRSLRGYSRLLMRRGDFEAAKLHWQRVRTLAPRDVEAHLAMARIHQRAKERLEAIALASAALRINPGHAEATRLRAALAEAELEDISGEISPGNAAQFAPRLAELEAAIGDHPILRRIRAFALSFENPTTGGGARNGSANGAKADLDEHLRLVEEVADAGRPEDFLSAAEDLVAAAGTEPKVVSLLNRRRGLLRSLAAASDPAVARRAGRLLRLASAEDPAPGFAGTFGRWSSGNVEADRAPAGFTGAGSLVDALDKLQTLAPHVDDPAIGPGLRRTFSTVLSRIEEERSTDPNGEADAVETELQRLAREHPAFARLAARFHADKGDFPRALDIYRRLEAAQAGPQVWLDAAKLASDANDTAALLEFSGRIAPGFAGTSNARKAAAELLAAHHLHDAALAMWRAAEAGGLDLRVRLGIVRALDVEGRSVELADEALRTLEDASPYERLGARGQTQLVEIVRRLIQVVMKAELGNRLADRAAAIAERNPGSAMAAWVLGLLDFARYDHEAALRRFQEGLRLPPVPAGVPVDFNAEIALLHARFYLFGEAGAAARALSGGVPRTSGHYRRGLEMLEPVAALCGDREDLRYPECLIDVILEEIAADPIAYEARAGHVVTVSSSLGQGGGERQTLTVLDRMARDPRLRKAALFVRSVARADQRFFLPAAQKLPIELTIYGENWTTRSDLAAEAPELARRERLAAAVELLPQNLREDLIRLCKRFWAERPQAVHLRQDLFGGALACAVAGVPRFFVHRGSLSPNLWEHNPLQAQIYLRPMRHTYRRLFERRPDFVIVNNSRLGSGTDQAWTEWPDASRFRVVYNAIGFDQLGPDIGRNTELRARLGIPEDAFVVGGAFRMVPVKRPLLWIEVARRVAEAHPAAHFLIIGDGGMRADVLAHAERHGFADRLHLPGRMSDVGDWFRAMDLQLLTSEREGLPNVLIEAQHFGVPAVSADVGGAAETIEAGVTGVLVPPDADAGAFAEAVLGAIRNPAWHATAQARARAFVHETFDADRAIGQMLELYGIDPRRPA